MTGGREHVQITPLSSPNYEGPRPANVTVHVSGNVLTRDYTRDEIIPEIKRAVRLGLA